MQRLLLRTNSINRPLYLLSPWNVLGLISIGFWKSSQGRCKRSDFQIIPSQSQLIMRNLLQSESHSQNQATVKNIVDIYYMSLLKNEVDCRWTSYLWPIGLIANVIAKCVRLQNHYLINGSTIKVQLYSRLGNGHQVILVIMVFNNWLTKFNPCLRSSQIRLSKDMGLHPVLTQQICHLIDGYLNFFCKIDFARCKYSQNTFFSITKEVSMVFPQKQIIFTINQ